MPNSTTPLNAKTLLKQLHSHGMTQDSELSTFVIDQHEKTRLPTRLKVLAGLGAFISASFFITFVAMSNLIQIHHDRSFIFWGLVSIVCAILIQRNTHTGPTLKQSFSLQSSFSFMVVGKILFVSGVAIMSQSKWGISWGLLGISSLTYFIFPVSTDRFLSALALFLSVLVNLLISRVINGSSDLMLNAYFLFQCLSVAFLLAYKKIPSDYRPLSDALIFSLCIHTLFIPGESLYLSENAGFLHSIFVNSVLTIGLLALIIWVAGGLKKLSSEPIILSVIAVALLGFLSAPSILLSIALIILGYAKHNKRFIGSGAFLLPFALFFYYYNLNLTLFQKSLLLIGNGTVLLLGRLYLKHKGWDKEGALCV